MVEDNINVFYDREMFESATRELSGDSLMTNFGYRTDPTMSQPEACRALVRRLLQFAPASPGTILDVACGLGGTTRMLADAYGPENITAINISDKQLANCRETVPGAAFVNMNATRLEFPNEHFDFLLCVEAAFHFQTRQRFFEEAHRVLKPGGRLVLSDLLYRPAAQFRLRATCPRENYVKDLSTYQTHLVEAGFARTEVSDATEPCWHGFQDYWWQFAKQRYSPLQFAILRLLGLRRGAVTHYVLAWAEKEF